jgi:Sugar (pentulose and hexulose) kinases
MGIIAIDLGTTNIKVAAYSDKLVPASLESHNVNYDRTGGFVEFDAEGYFATIVELIAACRHASAASLGPGPVQLVLTGQAESLVVVGRDGRPLRPGISWLDMRSTAECVELSKHLDRDLCYRVTGQPEIIPTWPLTKILWLRHNEAELFNNIHKFLMIKDYVLYRLTGRFAGEYSIYPFSHYFDITKKEYWEEPLAYCGVTPDKLPELVPPCSVVGELSPDILSATGLPSGSSANSGTLDHFAGMIGTGNVVEGMVSESAGTVSSIATFLSTPFSSASRIPLYCGPFENSYIYLPVCESGGISLEWFRNNFASDLSFRDIDESCAKRAVDPRLVFLPYLTGVNPPEFDANATGVFYGATVNHDKFDFSLAILYGVACLLRKNIDFFKASGINVDRVLSTGGGAKSALWSQVKADICNLPVVVPNNQEAPCLGAAIIGAVTTGAFPGYASAIAEAVQMENIYEPRADRSAAEDKYRQFCALYDALTPVFRTI